MYIHNIYAHSPFFFLNPRFVYLLIYHSLFQFLFVFLINVWLIYFGFKNSLSQFISLQRAVSQRERERKKEKIDRERINIYTTPIRTYRKHSRHLPYYKLVGRPGTESSRTPSPPDHNHPRECEYHFLSHPIIPSVINRICDDDASILYNLSSQISQTLAEIFHTEQGLH